MSVTDPTPAPAPAAPPRSSVKTLAVFTVIVAFVVGALIGAVGTWAWVIHHGGRVPWMAELREHRILRRLDRSLKLTPQQHEQVGRIIHEHGRHIDGILGGLQPQVRREIDQANVEIEKLLTAEQKVKFEELKMRLRSRQHKPAASSPAGSPTP